MVDAAISLAVMVLAAISSAVMVLAAIWSAVMVLAAMWSAVTRLSAALVYAAQSPVLPEGSTARTRYQNVSSPLISPSVKSSSM